MRGSKPRKAYLGKWRRASLAVLMLMCCHGYGFAQDIPQEAEVETRSAQVLQVGHLPSDASLKVGQTGQVFLEQAVGYITVGDEGIAPSGKAYPVRSSISGAGLKVLFSSSPPLVGHVSEQIGNFARPLAQATVTSRFGVERAVSTGTHRHSGVDLAAPLGSPVFASQDGRVSTASWAGSYGLLVVIEHPDGMQTRYAHLSAISVSRGQSIRKGEAVGRVGSTGRSTGPHLHYEIRQNGRPLDPLLIGG